MNSIDTRYFLSTDRVGFRWWQHDDMETAMQLWGNPEVTRLFHKEPLTEEQVAKRLEQEIESAQTHHIQYWPIFDLATNEHLGCAGLRPHGADKLELGIHLKPEFWGRGLATEVGRRVIQHAFDDGLTQAVFAGHHPENKASRDVLLKLGFLGTAAEFYRPTELFHPSYLLYRQSPPYKTRLATPRDARAIAIAHCQSIHEAFTGVLDNYVEARSLDHCEHVWEHRLQDPVCTTLVLLRGEQIVGFASVVPSLDEDAKGSAGELNRIYTHPSTWGSGQATILVNWSEAILKAQGFKTVKLWVFEINTRARQFYKNHGYQPDGCGKHDFETRLLRYGKEL